MFYGETVQDTRSQFFTSWDKYRHNLPLSPLESQIASIIQLHPEFHDLFDNPGRNLEKSFEESNPFMHLGLHLAIRDQVSMDKPAGIKTIYQQLLNKIKNPLEVEHIMMNTLAVFLFNIQKDGEMPDESLYLRNLQALITG